MDDLGAHGGRRRQPGGRALVVDLHRAGLVVLGAVDVGEGGAVDDRVGPMRPQSRVDRAGIADVEGVVAERDHLVRPARGTRR